MHYNPDDIVLANQMEIPEPIPIGPEGIHDVVPRLSLCHVAHWSNLELFREFIELTQHQDIRSSSQQSRDGVLSFKDELLPSVNSLQVRQLLHNKDDGFKLDEGNDATDLVETSTVSLSNVGRVGHSLIPIGGPSFSTVTDTKNNGPSAQDFYKARWNECFQELVAFKRKLAHLQSTGRERKKFKYH